MNEKPAYHHMVVMFPAREGKNDFAVVVVHDETPEWWRVLARFSDRKRAETYADVENDMAADGEHYDDGSAVPAPVASLPAAPPSRIEPENFRTPTPAEQARVGAHLIERAAAETGEQVTVTIEPPKRGGYRHGKRADAAQDRRSTSRAVSPEDAEKRTQAVLAAIIDLTAKGEKISYQTIGAKMGVSWGSIGPAIAELKKRGLIETFRHGQMSAEELREKGGIRLVRSSTGTKAAPPPVEARSTPPATAQADIPTVVVRPTDIRPPDAPVEYRHGRPPPKPKPGTVFESADDFARRGGTIKRIEPEKVPDRSGTPAFPRYGA